MVQVMARREAGSRDLETALQQVERQFGRGAIIWGDHVGALVAVDAIPTGSIALDNALGIGGLPRGRWVEIYGPEGSGKTTLALHAIANAQRLDPTCVCVFIDFEHALDLDYAKSLGVDLSRLLIVQPDTGEQGFEIAESLIRSKNVAVVVFDSTGAVAPRAEIEGEMGDSHVGLKARLISQALRKLTKVINATGTTGIFISQIYMRVGVMFGSPEETTGGRALKFYASIRLDVRRIETLKDGVDPVGSRTKVKVVKNKLAKPFTTAEFDIIFGHGISKVGSLIDVGLEQGIIRKSGAWYLYYPPEGDEIQLGQGKENARKYLANRRNARVAAEVEDRIREKLELPPIERRSLTPVP